MAAVAELGKSGELLQKLVATSEQYFPAATSLASLQVQYSGGDDIPGATTQNVVVERTIAATLDSADSVLNSIAKYQQYIALNIPKVADGGNFGVGIQMEALKMQSDAIDKINKCIDELTKYSSSRGDAIEKCKLPSVNQSTVQTSNKVDAASTGDEKGDTKTTSQSTSNETKVTETIATPPSIELLYRKAAVIAVDLAFYAKAKAAMNTIVFSYMGISDFMDKNKIKIEKPISEDSRSGGHNMY